MWAILAALLVSAPPGPEATVVRVAARWCAPCLEMEPGFARTERAFAGSVRFRVVDADADARAIATLGVGTVPETLIRFRGRTVERVVGYLTPGEQWALAVRASLWPVLAAALGGR